MPFTYNDPILSRRRKGDDIDPFVPIEEEIQVPDGCTYQLTEIPSRIGRVIIPGMVEVHQIPDDGLKENEFFVDYFEGLVTVHPSKAGQTLINKYEGTGARFFPASRVWTEEKDGEVTKTLGDIINAGKEAIDAIGHLDEKLDEINEALSEAGEATDAANNAADRAESIADVVEAAELLREAAEQVRENAELLRQSNEQTRQDQENARVEAEEDRELAEQDREYAEDIRQANELIRQQQESDRQTNTATAIANAEQATQNAQNLVDTYIHRGEYDTDTQYYKNNHVRYNGSTWRALQDVQGVIPTEGVYWTLVAQKGLDGTGTGTVLSVTSANEDISVTNPNDNPVLTLNSGLGANQIVKRNNDGDIEGNLIGNVTGNVTGDVVGNVTGNVTGNISGENGEFSDGVKIGTFKLFYSSSVNSLVIGVDS